MDEDKATAVVYDHSNAKLVNKKSKVRRCRKGAFLFRCEKRKLQIFIRNPLLRGPKTFCFQLDPKTPISSLKEFIHMEIGVKPGHQRLVIRRNARNFQLLDMLTLNNCGVQQDENISLCLPTVGLLGGQRVTDVILSWTISLAVIVVLMLWRQQREKSTGKLDKVPLSTTTTEGKGRVEDKFLLELSSKVQNSWEKLAKCLGYEDAEIKYIQTISGDNRERSCKMLLSWWRKQANCEAGYQKLRETLKTIGLDELALSIRVELPSLDDNTLYTLAEELSTQWEVLALKLDFKDPAIQTLRSNCQGNVVKQAYQMLIKWRQAQPDGVQEQTNRLCRALENIRRFDLAKMLQKFPRIHLETWVAENGKKSPHLTHAFWKSAKRLKSAHGVDYVTDAFYDFLKVCDTEYEDVGYKSVVFSVRVKSCIGLERLWTMCKSGELAKKLTEIFINDDFIHLYQLTTKDKSDLVIEVKIPESDYEEARVVLQKIENASEEDNRQIDDQFLPDSSSNEVQKYRKECTDYRENEETAIKRFQTLSQGNKERSSQIPTLQCGKQTNRKEGIQKRREPLESNGLTEQAPDNAQTDDQFLPDLSYSEAHECRKQFTEYKGYEEPETKQFQTLSEKNKEHCFRTLIWWWKKHVEGLQGLIKALESIGIPGQAFLTLGHEQDINSGTEEQPKLLGQTSTEATAYNYDRAELCC